MLTSDKPPVELKDIEQRLLTRFKWGLSALLDTPDYQTKIKIIRSKAQKLGAQISDEVVIYLADNISANVREIEGALSALVANASFLGRKITTALAKDILKVYVKLTQKEITIEHITKVVCEYFNIDMETFNSAKRTRDVAQARQIAMYLAKQHTKAPLTAIGSQPCHGAALVQSRKRHDGHRQELQAADRTDREDRTGKGISGKRTYVVRYGQDYRVLPCCFNIILPPGKYCRQRIIRIFAYRRTS